jgi:ribonuclease PH
MSSLLQSTLEAVVDVDKFPKASVDVNVLVLQVRPKPTVQSVLFWPG